MCTSHFFQISAFNAESGNLGKPRVTQSDILLLDWIRNCRKHKISVFITTAVTQNGTHYLLTPGRSLHIEGSSTLCSEWLIHRWPTAPPLAKFWLDHFISGRGGGQHFYYAGFVFLVYVRYFSWLIAIHVYLWFQMVAFFILFSFDGNSYSSFLDPYSSFTLGLNQVQDRY